MYVLLFFFIIISPHQEWHGTDSWREAPSHDKGYATLQECKDGQMEYRMNEETGAFSECYAREVNTNGK